MIRVLTMNFFRRFLGRKVAPESLDQKIESLDAQSQDFLANLSGDMNTEQDGALLRVAAVKRLSYGTVLRDLAIGESTKSDVKKTARQRIASLLDDKSISEEELRRDISSPAALISIAQYCVQDDFCQRILSGVNSSSERLSLVLSSIPAASKQALARQIDDEDTLRELLKASKTKDKVIYKIAKSKLDALKSQEQEKLETLQVISGLVSDIGQHAKRQVDVVYAARLDVLQKRWGDVELSASDEDKKAFNEACERCVKQIELKQIELKQIELKEENEQELTTVDPEVGRPPASIGVNVESEPEPEPAVSLDDESKNQAYQLIVQSWNLSQGFFALEKLTQSPIAGSEQFSLEAELSQVQEQWDALTQKLPKNHELVQELVQQYAKIQRALQTWRRLFNESSNVHDSLKCLSGNIENLKEETQIVTHLEKILRASPKIRTKNMRISSANDTDTSSSHGALVEPSVQEREVVDESAVVDERVIDEERVAEEQVKEEQVKEDQVKEDQVKEKPIDDVYVLKESELMVKARDALLAAKTSLSKRNEKNEKNIRVVSGLIRKANVSIDQGKLKTAVGIRRSIAHKSDGIVGVPSFISRQIEELDAAIEKMVDWQSYAVLPKKESLVASMKLLVGAELPADALATKIKKLQTEWKQLQQSGKEADEELWRQFKEYGDQAYEPCKGYFQELAEERQANLLKRQEMVLQLTEFDAKYDWEKPDWKMVENVLRTARSEFRACAPVDRAANESVVKEFESIASTIYDRLVGDREKNKQAKQQLIAQAENLVDTADIQQAISTVKRLQAQWKKIGACHYRDNDQLWKSFRVHCDGVFERKSEHDNATQVVTDEAIAKANQILAKANNLSGLAHDDSGDGDPQVVSKSDVQQLQQEFRAIENLPTGVSKVIERDLNTAIQRIEAQLKGKKLEQEEKSWSSLMALGNHLSHIETTSDSDVFDSLKIRIDQSVEAVRVWPENLKVLIMKRVDALNDPQRTVSSKSKDASQSVDALRLLCIRAEILANKESEPTDSEMRMQYQMGLLKEGVRYQRDDKTINSLLIDWVMAPYVDDVHYSPLLKRFRTTWFTLKNNL